MKNLLIVCLCFVSISLFGQSIEGSFKTLTASGTNTYTINELLPLSYDSKERFLVRFTNGNTGASTLNRATLGPKAIQKAGGVALSSGDIVAGGTYLLSYNGIYYQIVGDGGGGGGSGDMLLSGTQTNTGLKTFLNGTFGMRNVANTFTSQFTNTNTSAQNYTLPDFTGNVLVSGGTNTLSASTYINTGVNEFDVSTGLGTSFGSYNVWNDGASTKRVLIAGAHGTGSMSLSIGASSTYGNGAIFQDLRSTKKGLQYFASGYETDALSLTSKGYVDARLAGLTFTNSPSTNNVPTFNGTNWTFQTPSGGGSSTFITLTDAPSSYTSQAKKGVRVNGTPNGLEFYTITPNRTLTGAGAIVQTDENGSVVFNSATPFNFTIDQLTQGTIVNLLNKGSATVTLVAGSGVTITGATTLTGGSNYSAVVFYDTQTNPIITTSQINVNLATDVSGILPIANGGTGLSTIGASGTVLTSNGSSASWATPAAPLTLGQLFSENWANLTNWTTVGSPGASVASNILTLAGGTPAIPALSNYIRQSNYGKSGLENFLMEATITVGTVNSTSHGVGLGIQGQGIYGSFNILALPILNNSADNGKIAFYRENATQVSLSTGKITISTGDVLNVSLRRNGDTFIMTVLNTTTKNSLSHSFAYDYSYPVGSAVFTPNPFNYSIYSCGGTHTVANPFKVTGETVKTADLMILADSKETGYWVNTFTNRMVNILNDNYATCLVNGAPGALIEDINAAEVIAHQPAKIIIKVGVNNIGNGDTPATIITKLNTLTSALTGYTLGTNLFIGTFEAANTLDVTPTNALIRSTYSTASVIDFFASSWSGTGTTANPAYISPDGVHYNSNWARIETGLVVSTLGLKPKFQFKTNKNSPEYSSSTGNLGLSVNNDFGIVPRTLLDVVDTRQQQISFSKTSTGGGGLTSTSESEGFLTGGAFYTGAIWVARATSAGLIGTSAGDIYFSRNTGLTPGTSFTPTFVASITSSGLSLTSLGSGMVKSTSGLLSNATAGVDFQAPITSDLLLNSASTTFESTLGLARSRGTIGSPTTVINGDIVGAVNFRPHDGTGYLFPASIKGIVNGSVSSGNVPTDIVLSTGVNNSPPERFRISSVGAWGLSGTNYGTSGQVLTSQGSGSAPTWTTVSGSAFSNAVGTDANITAAVSTNYHLPAATLSTGRNFIVPTGADGNEIHIFNNEATYTWTLTGETVYLADRTTVVTSLLYNVPTFLKKINGIWIITN